MLDSNAEHWYTSIMKWQVVHERCLAAAKSAAGVDREICRLLYEAAELRVHERLGHGSVHEYAERVFGYGPHATNERIRVGAALVEMPETRRKFEAGELSYSAVRELTRAADGDNEIEWLER